MDKNTKHIVITGSASGIGLALVKVFLNHGAIVFGVDQASKQRIKHENYTYLKKDIASKEGVDAMFEAAKKHFGTIDIFIANAGIAAYSVMHTMDYETIATLFKTNTLSLIYSAKRLKQLMGNNPFHFVAMASVMAYWPLAGYSVYAASKAAIMTFMEGFRQELPKHQRLHTVFPVSTKTGFFTRAKQPHKPWLMQNPDHVAKVVFKGVKKNKKRIYPSKLFRVTHALCPWCLGFYKKREKAMLKAISEETLR